ncbi:MAG: tRNA (adenosine(37)-N6)-dimethylallyltransferase MiaA [Proteobacteria bacterium]|nr:tRNA (adenosine(37)-N6)-dimethylallyltransferase MiaA [Pseudomonadota bacterium]
MIQKPSAICLMGPTGSGKTNLAIELIKQLPCDIISVDSAMIYRGMDIGTAKPSRAILEIAPHRLIDIRDPRESYSVANFVEDATKEIESILAANRIPLLVGGTMMYFHALQQGLSLLPPADPEIRKTITEEAKEQGWPAMHDRLRLIDREAAERIKPTDIQRLQRALEVHQLTGKSMTQHWKDREKNRPPYHFINIALAPHDRSILHERIEQRFYQMLESGFMEEVKHLLKLPGLTADMPALRTVGYRQISLYLQGQYDESTMQAKAIAATRQLAKRQLTWLRGWENLSWFDSEDQETTLKVLELIATLK